MSKRSKPPFRADHVGSLLRSAPLKEARKMHASGAFDTVTLNSVEDQEIELVVKKQEEIGLDAVTDGEFRRSWWHLDFLWSLEGVTKIDMGSGIAFSRTTPRAEGLECFTKPITWDRGSP